MLPHKTPNGTLIKVLIQPSTADPAITTAEFWAGSHPDYPRYVLIFDLTCPVHNNVFQEKSNIFLLKSKDNCIQICRDPKQYEEYITAKPE